MRTSLEDAMMTDTTQKLEKMVAELRAERERITAEIDADIADLERVLKRRSGGKRRTANGATPPPPFQRKYKEKATTLVERLLESAGESRALPQIVRALEDDGKTFHRESINHALKRLEKLGKVRKVEAPEDSGYKWLYELNQPHLRAVEGGS